MSTQPNGNSWKHHPFFIRLFNWEYWPMGVVYFPVFIYYFWLSLKSRSFFFFSAANPSIETGGMLGESKIAIFDLIASDLKPVTLLIRPGMPFAALREKIEAAGITYPLIVKPDIGERGFMVAKITSETGLQAYATGMKVEFLVQEYVAYPVELGVLYYRFPGAAAGRIASIVIKEFLSITGDGVSSLKQLILSNPRAVLQWEKLEKKFGDRLEEVLPAGMILEMEPIGNHSRGTKFINGNSLIDAQLTAVFDAMTSTIRDVYYCRYDMRVPSLEDLRAGKNIRILELNGVGAEPAHIYDPGYSFFRAWGDILRLWNVMQRIAAANHKKGIPYMRYKAVKAHWKRMKEYKKTALS